MAENTTSIISSRYCSTASYNVRKFYVLPSQRIYVFYMDFNKGAITSPYSNK
jgi:hypothetical protein